MRHVGIAEPRGGLDQRFQHRLQIERRAADDLQHVAGRGLVFQRFLKIARAGLQRAIRLRAGDRDHRLLGEGFQQFDLAVGEAAGFQAVSVIGPIAASSRISGSDNDRLVTAVAYRPGQVRISIDIADVDDPPFQDRAAMRSVPRVGGMGNCALTVASAAASIAGRDRNMEQLTIDLEQSDIARYRTACAARRAIRSNTGCVSPGEADIAFSTSMVAA